MFKKVFLLFMISINITAFAEPEWFYKPPKASSYYYFAGVGKGKSKKGAKNAALADVFSQIIYMVRASISSNSQFEQYVEENEQDARRNSSVFKKVRAKGQAVIEQFEVDKQFTEKENHNGKTRNVFYILVKIPKSEITKARKKLAIEAQKRKENPMGVFVYAVFPGGQVMEVDTIKSELESLYKNMGFNIKSVDLEMDKSVLRSSSKTVSYLKREVSGEITKALICVIKPSGVRKERMGKFKITSILGSMTFREINLKTGEVASSNSLEGKGVSMRKDSSAVEDAFRKLIKNLTEELLKDPTGGSGSDDDDYM